MTSNNTLGEVATGESTGVGGANIRGLRFAGCSSLMLVSLIYYQLASLKWGTKRYWIPFCILVVYILFVHKGRQPVAIMGVIYFLYFLTLKGLSLKKFAMVVFPLISIISLIYIDPTILGRFTTIIDGSQSKDFSILARIKEVDQITPYIIENPILGVGNLSSHFKNGGFQTFFGNQFYIADIGFYGTIARGGILLIIIYTILYFHLWKNHKLIVDNFYQLFMKYMIISFVLLLTIFYNDILFDSNNMILVFSLYPLFSYHNSNKFILSSSDKYY